MAILWRSPVCSSYSYPSDRSNDDQEISSDREETVAVVVPNSGWYGVCVGRRLDEHHPTPPCACRFVAYIRSHDEARTALLDLPLADKDSIELNSIQAGKMIYLEKDSAASVSHRKPCQSCSSKNNNSSSSKNNNLVFETERSSSIEWCLLLLLKDDSNVTSKIGEESTMPKSILCATCGRLFANLKSVQTHVDSMHPKQLQNSSLWTTPLVAIEQDDYLVVINKPQGMAVMGGNNKNLIRSDLLMPFACPPTIEGALRKPTICHRLDAPTGGLLVAAKTKPAEVHLKQCFANRTCQKRYRALVCGRLELGVRSSSSNSSSKDTTATNSEDEGICELAISGKPSVTRFKIVGYSRSPHVAAHGGWVTTMDLFPVTGRKHQLRRHLKALGHPIWGDRRYGVHRKEEFGSSNQIMTSQDKNDEETIEGDSNQNPRDHPLARLCLWAMEISFPHPVTGDTTRVSMENPKWLDSLVAHQETLYSLATTSVPTEKRAKRTTCTDTCRT